MTANAIRLLTGTRNSNAGVLLPKSAKTPTTSGLVVKAPTQAQLTDLKRTLDGKVVAALDTTKFYSLAEGQSGRLESVTFAAKGSTGAVLLPSAVKGATRMLTIVQEDQAGTVAGGSTFIVRA